MDPPVRPRNGRAVTGLFAGTAAMHSGQANGFNRKRVRRPYPPGTGPRTPRCISHGIERDLSRYLLTTALINAGLGITVGLALFVIGVPNPLLWGVAVTLLNFVPYIGASHTSWDGSSP